MLMPKLKCNYGGHDSSSNNNNNSNNTNATTTLSYNNNNNNTKMAHKKMRYLDQSLNNNNNSSSSNNNNNNNTSTSTNSNSNNNNLSSSSTTPTTTNSSVKQLITTAAAGNGVVDDVDELLTPMVHHSQQQHGHHRRHSSSPKHHHHQRNDGRPERNLWSKTEMLEMLKIMHEQNAIEKLNDKTIKSDSVFRDVEEVMHDNGFRKKSHVQIWTKWKFLKSTYNTTKRNGTVPKMIPLEVYQQLYKLLDGSASAGDSSGGGGGGGSRVSDCENSMQSMNDDGDGSNGGISEKYSPTTAKATIQNGGTGRQRMKTTSMEEIDNDNDDDLNVAHPIFGFRLGLVKPEPADTGYETNIDTNESIGGGGAGGVKQDPSLYQNQSVHSQASRGSNSFDHIPFEIVVKTELIEPPNNANTPPPTAPASPTSILHVNNLRTRLQNEPVETNKRLGRHSSTIVPMVTSTPNNGSGWNSSSRTSGVVGGQKQMPPLRVANFAKEHKSSTFKSGVMKIDNSKPTWAPTMMSMKHPTTCLNNTNDIVFTTQHEQPQNNHNHQQKQRPTPRLILPKLPPPDNGGGGGGGGASQNNHHQLPYLSYARLSKEISLQPARNTNMLKLKQVPMRKTPYSLRPERMIPDLDQSISPPPSPVPTNANNYQHHQHQQHQYPIYNSSSNMATTSRQAQAHHQHHRKRRLEFDIEPTLPMKFKCIREEQSEDDGGAGSYVDKYNSNGVGNVTSSAHKQQTTSEQQKHHDASLEKELNKLVDSLQQTQRDLMQDFFKQQKEFARREHEFQMKQDLMILRAFHKQTDELMKSAKKMLNVNLNTGDEDDQIGKKSLPKNSVNGGNIGKIVTKPAAVEQQTIKMMKKKNNHEPEKQNNNIRITKVKSLANHHEKGKGPKTKVGNDNECDEEGDDDDDDDEYGLKVLTDNDDDSADDDDVDEHEDLVNPCAASATAESANAE